jgi:hypothetical protein
MALTGDRLRQRCLKAVVRADRTSASGRFPTFAVVLILPPE